MAVSAVKVGEFTAGATPTSVYGTTSAWFLAEVSLDSTQISAPAWGASSDVLPTDVIIAVGGGTFDVGNGIGFPHAYIRRMNFGTLDFTSGQTIYSGNVADPFVYLPFFDLEDIPCSSSTYWCSVQNDFTGADPSYNKPNILLFLNAVWSDNHTYDAARWPLHCATVMFIRVRGIGTVIAPAGTTDDTPSHEYNANGTVIYGDDSGLNASGYGNETSYEGWGGGQYGIAPAQQPYAYLVMQNRLATLPRQYDGLDWTAALLGTATLRYGTGTPPTFTPPTGCTIIGEVDNNLGNQWSEKVVAFYMADASQYLLNLGWDTDDFVLDAHVDVPCGWAMQVWLAMPVGEIVRGKPYLTETKHRAE